MQSSKCQDAGREGSLSDKVVLNFDIGNGDITKAYFCCDEGTCDKVGGIL